MLITLNNCFVRITHKKDSRTDPNWVETLFRLVWFNFYLLCLSLDLNIIPGKHGTIASSFFNFSLQWQLDFVLKYFIQRILTCSLLCWMSNAYTKHWVNLVVAVRLCAERNHNLNIHTTWCCEILLWQQVIFNNTQQLCPPGYFSLEDHFLYEFLLDSMTYQRTCKVVFYNSSTKTID